ncbi:MAG: UDP-N-acetylmuramoyl-L-alanyl-D-glutamate--2,6-diaminopimelate ligase, partial [candidate division Zixibacteria bacterium]|nr:UDP-N-acetylmuramoyl-L-alanyl-D-glutamate--2,6-diaminopimelate ligase [candidate division Zixibacteria bacterium]
ANGAIAVIGERAGCEGIANHVQVPDIRSAMAEVSARFYGFPGLNLKAIGVTGTNGKTTTCFLIKKILEAAHKPAGLATSLVYDTGTDKFEADRTTPESLDMQRLLYLMKRNYCLYAALEVSSHALVLHRVDFINFRVAVYTNFTRDHLDFHGTMENYFQAKAQLARRLEGPLSYAVINLDVPEFHQLFGILRSPFLTFALEDRTADVYCANYELTPDQTMFDLVTPVGTQTVTLKLPGRFNLINAIGAATAGLACGTDLDSVIQGLEAAMPIPGRLNTIKCGQPFAVYVDYAHTPDAIERLCDTVKELSKGKLHLLFGCGGDRDRGKRPLMAQMAIAKADHVVVTSDNPRSEDPLAIIDEIKPGLSGNKYEIIPDRAEAIRTILRQAGPGDLVLLAGKGAEPYQEIKGVKHPFEDAAVAREALAELGYREQAVVKS